MVNEKVHVKAVIENICRYLLQLPFPAGLRPTTSAASTSDQHRENEGHSFWLPNVHIDVNVAADNRGA